uniref:Uncharacterized protein n=1 Tax=Arundo donax TaxID=35708 RepID=A0A0A8XXA3_ARUDO
MLPPSDVACGGWRRGEGVVLGLTSASPDLFIPGWTCLIRGWIESIQA